eukprot:TRINITY_DN13860_c0_g1_i1.p1 TRINITY_DN13860_c0_g1~~TRINITY_DN13860_c0_g1_i1.p1  ORF type:complete len:317 (-),score=44.21 TRINITY_DN13860_c0_g1_i1:13-963(-)
MASPSPSSTSPPPAEKKIVRNFTWNEEMEDIFIKEMVNQCNLGRRLKVGIFHRTAWAYMVKNLNKNPIFANTGRTLKKDHLYNRLRVIRKHYPAMKKIFAAGGFEWDRETKKITAEPDVWNAFIAAEPWASAYRDRKVKDWDSLCLLYCEDVADGRDCYHPNDEATKPIALLEASPQYMLEANESPQEDLQDEEAQEAGSPFTLDSVHTPINNTRRKAESSSSSRQKKPNIGERILECMQQYTNALNTYINRAPPPTTSQQFMAILDEMKAEGSIDDNIYMEACFKLTDKQVAETFLALHPSRRQMYLLKLTDRRW